MEERKREVDGGTWSFPNLWVLLRFENMWGCAWRELSHTHDFKWFSIKRTHEYMEVSKVTGSLEVQERMRVCLKTPELDSHPWVILPQETMSTWSSWEELGGSYSRLWVILPEENPQGHGGSHALAKRMEAQIFCEWYLLNLRVLLMVGNMWGYASRESMEVLTSSSDTSWTRGFSWGLGTCEGVSQENLVILTHLGDPLSRNHKSVGSFPTAFPFFQGKKEHLCRSLSQSTLILHNFHNLWNFGNYQIYILLLITLSTYAGIIFQ